MELTGRLITSFSTSLRVSSSSALNQNSIKSFHSSVSLRASGTNVPKKNKASASQLKTGGFRRKTSKSKVAAGGKGDAEEGKFFPKSNSELAHACGCLIGSIPSGLFSCGSEMYETTTTENTTVNRTNRNA
eukprot:TRINITY_DN5901_c0_g1_i1.p1 TRINITY_DN5901_c0_g1~~TRINITY_DN5901_c0_g1_i1.p1  ORF type:complete len:131 (-),score=14.17 TRINITY_DN5901_c0_g1_i1:232-624(-)